MNVHDHNAGAQLLAFLTTAAGVVAMAILILREKRSRDIGWARVPWERDLRLLTGGFIEVFAQTINIGVFLPIWPLLSVEAFEEAKAYNVFASWVDFGRAFVTCTGFVIIFWPLYHRVFRQVRALIMRMTGQKPTEPGAVYHNVGALAIVLGVFVAIYLTAARLNPVIGYWLVPAAAPS
jgi:hypothetical protein